MNDKAQKDGSEGQAGFLIPCGHSIIIDILYDGRKGSRYIPVTVILDAPHISSPSPSPFLLLLLLLLADPSASRSGLWLSAVTSSCLYCLHSLSLWLITCTLLPTSRSRSISLQAIKPYTYIYIDPYSNLARRASVQMSTRLYLKGVVHVDDKLNGQPMLIV